jgi:hypothetical protein
MLTFVNISIYYQQFNTNNKMTSISEAPVVRMWDRLELWLQAQSALSSVAMVSRVSVKCRVSLECH